jgi:hypothetical protein
MSTSINFLILYLIPLLSFAGATGVYLHAHGKPPEDTFINFAFICIVIGFVASCFITTTLVSHFSSDAMNYFGIVFSILAWFIEYLVVGLYLVSANPEIGVILKNTYF